MIRHAVEIVKHECDLRVFYNPRGELDCDCPFYTQGVCLLTDSREFVPCDWDKQDAIKWMKEIEGINND